MMSPCGGGFGRRLRHPDDGTHESTHLRDRRLPDTTLRNVLCTVEPNQVRKQILDTALAEDDHHGSKLTRELRWLSPSLRRIAYSILTLVRSVTQRGEEWRHAPWKRLIADVWLAFVTMMTGPPARPSRTPRC